MKSTIFTRILFGTLTPVLIVFTIVISTIHSIISLNDATYVNESVRLTAIQISEQLSGRLENLAVLESNISMGMSGIDFDSPDAKKHSTAFLRTLLSSAPYLYSAWYAFEPETFTAIKQLDEKYYHQILLNTESGIQEVSDIDTYTLNNPELSPWYNEPFETGEMYINLNETYRQRSNNQTFCALTMSHPIIKDGVVIGCVGTDIRYEDLFHVENLVDQDSREILLLSDKGKIIFSYSPDNLGKSLFDFNFQKNDAIFAALEQKTLWQDDIISPFSGQRTLSILYPFNISSSEQTVYLYRGLPAEKIYGIFYSSMEVIVITGFLGLILLAFCVYFTTRSIVRHIKRITDNFHLIANSGVEVTISEKSVPIIDTNIAELEILQSALTAMMKHLRKGHELKLKTIEDEIEKERLLAAAEAKTNFFASMSHEIRTPMNAILGISEIMLNEGKLSQSQTNHIKNIKISSDALLNIINDILDISKMETGKMSLVPEHYNFKALIDNVSSLSNHLALDAGIKFSVETIGQFPNCLYGDGMRLRQVLLNLIGNSIKYTKKGFTILRITFQESIIHFDIIDSGVGIKKEDIGSIFDSFKRVDTRRNKEIKGTGLGLSISKNIVELMGGFISVKSVYGEGSTFSFTIPLISGDKIDLRYVETDISVRYSDALRVLIVDDNEINLNVSSGLFNAIFGIACDTAISGRDAIAKVQETNYDIIFMDHMMPELDGIDTTRCIRNLGDKYKKIPIVALTANAVVGTREYLLSSGLDDYLTKPIQMEKLKEVLYEWIPDEKRLRPDMDNPVYSVASDNRIKNENAEKTSDIIRKLSENVGIFTRAGLENIGLDEEMYLQSLRLLRQKIPQTLKLLSELLTKKDMREFRIHVHGLKGSLASIGAPDLSEYAKKLEIAAGNDNIDFSADFLPTLEKNLNDFCKKLDTVLPPEKEPELTAVYDNDEVEQAIKNLRTALNEHDYVAITNELNIILTANINQSNNNDIIQLKYLIDNFEYSSATALIDKKLLIAHKA